MTLQEAKDLVEASIQESESNNEVVAPELLVLQAIIKTLLP